MVNNHTSITFHFVGYYLILMEFFLKSFNKTINHLVIIIAFIFHFIFIFVSIQLNRLSQYSKMFLDEKISFIKTKILAYYNIIFLNKKKNNKKIFKFTNNNSFKIKIYKFY